MHNLHFCKPAKYFLKIISIIAFLFMISGWELQAQDEGEQLFKVCAACHTIGKGKLIGPDLKGVTGRLEKDWLHRFIINSQEVIQSGDEYAVKIFQENNNIPMPPNNFTTGQVDAILTFIENYDAAKLEEVAAETIGDGAEQGEEPAYVFMAEEDNPYSNLQISFFISVIIILIALFDLFVTRIVKAKAIHLIIILISIAVITEVAVIEAQSLGRQLYYEPDQPIQFSHKVHAGDNQTDCKYCHSTADESMHAGIPSVAVCMNCHNVVKEGTQTGKEEIAKIYAAIETHKPIEWVKVHNLPDHVYFNHAQHVSVGNIDCAQCHGEVKEMDRIQQVNNLGMGWCVNCHRRTEVQFINNDFYKNYEKLHEQLKSGKKKIVTVDDIGGNDCQKCHY
ncbi:MAG: cytochrome c3 family protein [Bacteroidota bacterium]|nr:cytochrome c3 family protein [Bacteroidota bacterium]